MNKTLHIIRTLSLILVVLTLGAPAAFAQGDPSDNVVDLIARNAVLLEQATNLVQQTNSAKARASLDAAMKLHQHSRELLAAGNTSLAAGAAVRARQAILNTISIARREVRIEQNAIATMERANLRLQQARALYEEYGRRDDVPVRKLIDESRNQLQRARDNMREHLFDIALQLANASLDMSNRAIQLLKRDTVTPEHVFREIERTDAVIERVLSRDESSVNPATRRAARAAMERAVDLQRRAKYNGRTDNYRLALEQTQRAREIATRVARGVVADVEPDRESVARALRYTDDLLDRARTIAGNNDAPRLDEKIDEALRLQTSARNKFDAQQYRAALTMTLRARDIVRGALQGVDRPLDAQSVADALARTDEAIDRLSARVGDDDATAKSLLERARDRQTAARTALDAGQLRRALAMTRVARDLARRALEELGVDEGM